MLIQHFVQGDNAQNDYRLIKQSNVFARNGYLVDIQHFHISNSQRPVIDLTSKIKITSRVLITRKLFKLGRFQMLKLLEQWLQIIYAVIKAKPNGVILHDERLFGAIIILGLLKKIKYIDFLYWDLRELPEDLMKNASSMFILKIAISVTDKTFSASYLRSRFLALLLKKDQLTYLENYPDEQFFQYKNSGDKYDLPEQFVYLQSPSEKDRFLHNTINGLIFHTKYSIVITGRLSKEDAHFLNENFRDQIGKRILILGLIPTSDLAHIIFKAQFSIVLYKADKLNRRFCAPNRLFQSLAVGTPMLLGNNLSMLALKKRYNAGICLTSDGSDFIDLIDHLVGIETGQLVFPKIDRDMVFREINTHDWDAALLPNIPDTVEND